VADAGEVYTLALVAEILGENADWLWEISCEMDVEDGCISIFAPNDEYIVGFTPDGIDHLRRLVEIYKANPSLLTPPLLDS
jgi:hypothetical protein